MEDLANQSEGDVEVTSVRVIEAVMVGGASSEEKSYILAPISIRQHLQKLRESNISFGDDDEYLYRNILFFSILLCILLAFIIFCLVATNWFYEVFGWSRVSSAGTPPTIAEFRRKQAQKALALTKIELWSPHHHHFPNNVSCVICLEDFEQGDLVRKLNCDHVFHVKCVDNWILKTKAACPICKKHVSPPPLPSIPVEPEPSTTYTDMDDHEYSFEMSTVGNDTIITITVDSSPATEPTETPNTLQHQVVQYFPTP